jgi:DsbC/DsbD-like thiol-disulfide interchange protein
MMILSFLLFFAAGALFAAGDVEVRHDDKLAVTYRAAWTGDHVVVRASIEPGWHTFCLDNKIREKEKLRGKPSLGSEMPTAITLSGGLQEAGAWLQTPPKDFSKPAERYYSFGYDREAVFAVPVKRTGKAPGQVALKAQACTESVCKNIDIDIPVQAAKENLPAGLIPVKMQ